MIPILSPLLFICVCGLLLFILFRPTKPRHSITLTHAERELDILHKIIPDNVVMEFRPEILALCNKFGNSGQSGGSAPQIARAISQAVEKLCLQETIAPLTGEADEWSCGHMNSTACQNRREGTVFKESKNSRAYYLDAIIFRGAPWDQFSGTVEGICSRQFIKSFPFTPKKFYIDVYREEYNPVKHAGKKVVTCGPGDMVYFIKDWSQVEKVFEYYDEFIWPEFKKA